MQLTRKTYQRINPQGQWLGAVEVMPSIIPNDDGVSFSIAYQPTEDLVDAPAPENPDQVWVNGGWCDPVVIIPDRPEPILLRRIDNDGFFVADVLIEPTLHENYWVFLGSSDPLLIETPIDQLRPWYKPRWDGMEWVESLAPQQIEEMNPHVVDWVQFFKDFQDTDLDEAIWDTKDKRSLRLFDRALMANPPDPVLIFKHWNACAESVTVQIEQLQAIALEHKAPIEVDELGMVNYGV